MKRAHSKVYPTLHRLYWPVKSMALMQDNDWMIPRLLHTRSAEEHEPRPNGQSVTIDPEFLQRRAQRMQTLPVGPSNTLEDEPWAYIDRRLVPPGMSSGD